ncbi:MAG: WS/DGAT domain-containing protein [bacterium]|nr:WS/DGAT domain-containing protein [bacterium]
MNAIDSFFLSIDGENTSQKVGCLGLCEGVIDKTVFIERLRQLLPRMPQLATLLPAPANEGHRKSIPDFDPVTNVSSTLLRNSKEMEEHVAAHFSSRFRQDLPPWHLNVISFEKDDKPQTAFLYEIHHSLADGIGGIELVYAMLDSQVNSLPGRHLPPLPQNPDKATLGQQLRAITREIRSSITASSFNGINSQNRRFIMLDFDKTELTSLKRLVSTGFNDLMLAAVAIASRYYQERGKKPLTALRAVIPINLRTSRERYDLGNRLTGASFPLSLATDIRQQLQDTTQTINRMRHSGAFSAYSMLARGISRLPAKAQLWFYRQQIGRTNFICTNMPGPLSPQKIADNPLSSLYIFPALMPGHGLGYGFYTYCNKVHVSLTFDPAIIADENLLHQCLKDAFRDLLALAKSAV